MRTARITRSFVIGLAALLAAVAVPLYGVKVARKADYTDFSVYYKAGSLAAQGEWSRVYDLSDGASPFRYSPVTLPFFALFSPLGPEAARLTWYGFQLLCFGASFWLLFLCLRRMKAGRDSALFVTSLSFLFVLRFCLDTLTIGQVSSVMLLGFTVALFGWVFDRPGLAGAGLFVPSLLKIGPGVGYLLFALGRPSERRLAVVLVPSLLTLLLLGVTVLWIGDSRSLLELLQGWAAMVAADSSYYDASHYGSQSLKSFFLRAERAGYWSAAVSSALWLGSAALLVGGAVSFWALRRARGPLGRGLFYSIALFLVIWLMPETFKYSLTPLAIPVALLWVSLAGRSGEKRLGYGAIAFGFLTLSLAGKDVVGDTLFFGLQKASFPLAATLLLGWAVWREAWLRSIPSPLAKALGAILTSRRAPPWSTLPARASLEGSLLLPIHLDAASCSDVLRLERLIADCRHFLRERWGEQAELLLIPYGNRVSSFHPAQQLLERVAARDPRARLIPPSDIDSRSAALREGFLASRGKRLLIGNAEQPCELSFFAEALPLLEQGHELVRANRRLPKSRFKVPVLHLPLVYRRHRLGLAFNRLVRLLLPIRTTDTHAGTYALTRGFAHEVFFLQTDAGFLFDLEVALIALAQRRREADLPVVLYLAREKTPATMASETLTILAGLPRLARRWRNGYYRATGPLAPTISGPQGNAITADDWGISPAVNAGILDLARRGVIRRVSLMADTRYLNEGLAELQQIPGIELGLHFNLTYGKPDHGPAKILLRWLSPLADRAALRASAQAELRVQLAKLRDAGVIRVSYLDGHHHIHIVPGMLDALAPVLKEAGIREIRLPRDPAHRLTAKLPLWLLAGWLERPLRHHGFSARPFFYPSLTTMALAGELRAELVRRQGCEVVTHPATRADREAWEFPDPYVEGRVVEYRTLRMLSPEAMPEGES